MVLLPEIWASPWRERRARDALACHPHLYPLKWVGGSSTPRQILILGPAAASRVGPQSGASCPAAPPCPSGGPPERRCGWLLGWHDAASRPDVPERRHRRP